MPETLSFDELDARAEDYDRAVAETEGVDRFCSSSVWILPAAHHLMPPALPVVLARGNIFVALAETPERGGSSVLHPLEATWGLPCPLIGADVEGAVELFMDVAASHPRWRVALLTGLVEGSPLWRAVSHRTSRAFVTRVGPRTRRYVADLTAGVDGFLARRSPGFRRNLKKAERRAAESGLRFEVHDDDADVDACFERLLAVERRSWKGRSGVGIDREPMRSFYREMQARLARRGALRLSFARIDGSDVAYVLGGVLGGTYRGLQFSYDAEHAELSLGSLCQMHEIRRLVAGGALRYDLGTEVGYKRRWGEEVFVTHSLVLHR